VGILWMFLENKYSDRGQIHVYPTSLGCFLEGEVYEGNGVYKGEGYKALVIEEYNEQV